MAVYQFIEDEFVIPKHYLPKMVHTIGESSSLHVNDEFHNAHDKVLIGDAAKRFLSFVRLRKGIIIYHTAERRDLCKGKPWNTYNHFHFIWKSSCEPRRDSSWYNVTKSYHKATGFRRTIPKVINMKFPSSACNYYCKKPRQIIIWSEEPVLSVLSSWCTMTHLEKPPQIKQGQHNTSNDILTEPMFTNVSGGSLNLFNYHNWVWTSKSYRSESEMKADWIGRSHNPNSNFMRAISHPQYNTIIKKVIDCDRIKLINQSFIDKYNKKDWNLYLNNTNYLSLDISLRLFRLLLRKQNIDISTFVNDVWNILNQKFPKKNLLVLQGVPDSGKSTIARSIVDLFQHNATVQGTASFPFMSLVNVEIGLIEEPNMTMETLQTFKKIAEGVDTEVCIKYGADQTIKRTPLIITSNHDFDQHAQYIERQAFKSRYIKYQFTIASDFLAKAKKPLNPALWNSLFEEYVLSE